VYNLCLFIHKFVSPAHMDRGMRPSMFLLEINDTTYLHRGISNYNSTMDTLCINVFGDNANLGNNSAYRIAVSILKLCRPQTNVINTCYHSMYPMCK